MESANAGIQGGQRLCLKDLSDVWWEHLREGSMCFSARFVNRGLARRGGAWVV